jgi:ATP-dependent phosphofructokinase / diphosphate-dependent phosphofructokinase
MRNGTEVIGMKHGYSSLADYSPAKPLAEGRDYIRVTPEFLKRTRSGQGIMIGTARTNPGKHVASPAHLDDPERVQPLKNVYEGLRSLGVEALISIGGDDTLKTANKFKLYQDRLPADAPRIPVVHLPKTIDNDYMGIDFTFGYFTAVDTLGAEIRNLLYDADASRSYFLCETMGRSAGWLSYGAAIAGEASLVISVEDIHGKYRSEETVTSADGTTRVKPVMNIDEVVNRIVKTMRVREEQEGKQYGVIVMAEGLAEYLPAKSLEGITRDEHGHISITDVQLGRMFAKLVAAEYKKQTGRTRKVVGLQLGPERCHGERVRAARSQLRAIRGARRSQHARDGRPLRGTRQRLPQPGPISRDVCQRVVARDGGAARGCPYRVAGRSLRASCPSLSPCQLRCRHPACARCQGRLPRYGQPRAD